MNETDEILLRLQRWYEGQCDGEWEHGMGVRIETLDNPGWQVTVDLAGTPLESRPFSGIEQGIKAGQAASADWHSIVVQGTRFRGAGDSSKLGFILKTFLNWAEGVRPTTS